MLDDKLPTYSVSQQIVKGWKGPFLC